MVNLKKFWRKIPAVVLLWRTTIFLICSNVNMFCIKYIYLCWLKQIAAADVVQFFLRGDQALWWTAIFNVFYEDFFFSSPGHYRCLPHKQHDAFCLSRVRRFECLNHIWRVSGFQDEIVGNKAASWRRIKVDLGGQTYLLSFNVQSYLCAMSPAGSHKD